MDDQVAQATALPRTTDISVRATACHRAAVARSGLLGQASTLRVVHISLGMNVGGMEKLLVEFARCTDRQRFDLAFISLEQRGELATEIENLQWPVYSLGKRPGQAPGIVLRLARQLRMLRPAVVHTHNVAALFYGGVAAQLARVPRIIHTQHGQRFRATPRQTWFFRLLSRCTYRIISVSQDARQRIISDGIRAERTCVIRNGVDLSRFSYTEPDPEGPAVLVARLSPEKDVATLIRAMSHARQMLGPEQPGFTLDIVGDGAARTHLQSLAHSLNLGHVVRFLGERNDVPALLGNASMFVLPSLTEGISLTLLEAMARGLPVIATRVGGNPEVVRENVSGLLVPVRDPVALAAAMVRLRRNPGMAAQMGLLGRWRVEQEFSVEEMIRQYEQQYVSEIEP